ncbi:MAG: hypothetical protein ACI8WM_001173 [Burkholderiaceae bacterium]|jgi:hypothetical protein
MTATPQMAQIIAPEEETSSIEQEGKAKGIRNLPHTRATKQQIKIRVRVDLLNIK